MSAENSFSVQMGISAFLPITAMSSRFSPFSSSFSTGSRLSAYSGPTGLSGTSRNLSTSGRKCSWPCFAISLPPSSTSSSQALLYTFQIYRFFSTIWSSTPSWLETLEQLLLPSFCPSLPINRIKITNLTILLLH